MGASFVNVQVRVGGGEAASAAVITALREVLGEQGFVPVSEGEAAERSVVVRAGAPWIAIYDAFSEETPDDSANQLACSLSRRLSTQACVVFVHHSDVLELGLFDGGAELDRYNSRPDYFTKPTAAERKALAGKPEAWSGVLRAGATPAELRRVWRKKQPFAEDTLVATAALVGFDAERARSGYRYYVEEPQPDALVLGFRRKVPHVVQAPRRGPPLLKFASSGHPRPDVALGGRLLATCSVRSYGGAGRGLTLSVQGDALALLTLEEAELLVTLRKETTRHRASWSPDPSGEPNAYVASFPDLRIASAPSPVLPSGFTVTDPRQLDEESQKILMFALIAVEGGAMELAAHVHARGARLGTGSLRIGIVADEVPASRYEFECTVRVLPPAHRPLRGLADEWVVPRVPERMLLALCSFDLERERAAAIAARLIERFAGCFEASEELDIGVVSSEAKRRVRTSKAARREFFGGRRWKKVVAELPVACEITLACRAERGAFGDPRRSDGASFGGLNSRWPVAGDPELPTLAFWCDLVGASAERARAVRELADELMTEVMLEHSGVQAVVGYAASAFGVGMPRLAYEERAGIHDGTLRRSWLERFVRSVGVGTLWLGASLLAKVPERAALERAARLESFSGAVRITMDRDEEVVAVEEALLPLLPSAEDWQEACRRST